MIPDALVRKWCPQHGTASEVSTPLPYNVCACGILAASIREALEEAEKVVQRHRRHVELSPGVGDEVQKYGIAVADDILLDFAILRGTP